MRIKPLQWLNAAWLPLFTDADTGSISAENPTGAKGGGAQEAPEGRHPASMLGKGWKIRPCITLQPGEFTDLAEIAGPGIIQHIWITVDPVAYRDVILRMYWDGETRPSVETPLGDFFCNGHALRYNVNSLPVTVNPSGGFNSYWSMPFRESARITIENQHPNPIDGFFYQITYALTEIPQEAAYFHAQWRRSLTTRKNPEHIILDGIQGKGHYVGTLVALIHLKDNIFIRLFHLTPRGGLINGRKKSKIISPPGDI